jgi:hypothetical protein
MSEEGKEATDRGHRWATSNRRRETPSDNKASGQAMSKEGEGTTPKVGGWATHESGGWATTEEPCGQAVGVSGTGQSTVSDGVEPMVLGELSLMHHLLEDIGGEQHTDLFMGTILWFLKEDVLPEDAVV